MLIALIGVVTLVLGALVVRGFWVLGVREAHRLSGLMAPRRSRTDELDI